MYKILAVDDDKSMTDYYSAIFSEAGYEVRTASDAVAGMEVFYDFHPHLIVLDAEMPEGGGEKVFSITRKLLASGTPVVFVTGLPERVTDYALTHTSVRVFAKPVKQEELLDCVAGMLGRQGG